MRSWFGGICVGAALVLGAVGLAACQRQQPSSGDAVQTPPSNAEREAAIAAEQLAALGGPATPAQRALYEGEFQASGDVGAGEGAWELRLFEDYAQFARPGLGEDGGVASERDYREHGMRVIAGPLTITLRQEACTVSGLELPYAAHVLFEGVAYQGCARRGLEAGERPTWASVLPELMPAIDVCLARAVAHPARIAFAAAIGDNSTSVRIREADGSRRECIVNAAGEVAVYEPLSDIDRRAGEGDPEFQRGGAQPPARNCRSVEAVAGRDGAPLGWLIRRSC